MQGRYEETIKKLHELYQKAGRKITSGENKLINQAVPDSELKTEVTQLKGFQSGIQSALAILEVDQQTEMFG